MLNAFFESYKTKRPHCRLKEFGFEGPYAGGKHQFMIKGNLRLTIPNPHESDIGINLLSKILKQAGISKEEWENK